MLTSITPLGEQGRNRNWSSTVAAYFIGSIAGGAVTGAAFGAAGSLLPGSLRPDSLGWAIVLLLAVVAADEMGWINITPLGRRQVNEDWVEEYRGWVVGVGFGFQLGLGFVTIVTTLALPATFLLAGLTFSWQAGLAVGVTFGVARAVPILRTKPVTDAARLARLHRTHDAAARWAHIAVAAAVVPLAVIAVVA